MLGDLGLHEGCIILFWGLEPALLVYVVEEDLARAVCLLSIVEVLIDCVLIRFFLIARWTRKLFQTMYNHCVVQILLKQSYVPFETS